MVYVNIRKCGEHITNKFNHAKWVTHFLKALTFQEILRKSALGEARNMSLFLDKKFVFTTEQCL